MGKIIILSAVLCTILSFHGALGYCGWLITPRSMETCYASSRDIWSSRVEQGLKSLPATNFNGFLLGCQIGSCIYKRVQVTVVPGTIPVINVLICFEIRLDCARGLLGLLRLRVTLCVNVRMRVTAFPLVTDSCMLHSIAAVVSPVGVQVVIPTLVQDLLAELLGTTVCDVVLVLFRELNCILNVALGPHPSFPGCHFSYFPYSPIVSSNALEVYFSLRFTCGGVVVPFPTHSSYGLTISGSSDPNSVTFFITDTFFNSCLDFLLEYGYLNSSVVTSVTTTIFMEHFPEFICPPGLMIRLRIIFTKIYIEMSGSTILLSVYVRFQVGYELPGDRFFTVLHVDMTAKFALSLVIDCPRGWLVASVALSTDIQITTTCKVTPCAVGGSAINDLLQLDTRCRDIINARLQTGVLLPFPIGIPCSVCRQTVITGKYIAWSCTISCVR